MPKAGQSQSPELKLALDRSRLKAKADKLGIEYLEDVDIETLRTAIAQFEEAKAVSPKAEEKKAVKAEVAPSAGITAQDMATAMQTLAVTTAEATAKTVSRHLRADDSENLEERDIDPDDEVPAKSYFTFGSFWIMDHKTVGGQHIKPPYGLKQIIFQRYDAQAVQNGKQNNTKYSCIYTTKSKKIQTWIETSREFCDPFFKRICLEPAAALSMNMDNDAFSTYTRHRDNLENKMHPELMRMALGIPEISEGISINTTMKDLRGLIARAYTQAEMRQKGQFIKHTLKTAQENILTGV